MIPSSSIVACAQRTLQRGAQHCRFLVDGRSSDFARHDLSLRLAGSLIDREILPAVVGFQRAQSAAKTLDGNRPVLEPALRKDGQVDAEMGLDAAPGDLALERVEPVDGHAAEGREGDGEEVGGDKGESAMEDLGAIMAAWGSEGTEWA